MTPSPKKSNCVDEELVIVTFKYLARRNLVTALDKIQELSFGKKNKAIYSKKEAFQTTIKWAVLAALGKMITTEKYFAPEQQTLIYRVINNSISLPNDVINFAREYEKVTEVVPYLRYYHAPQELIDKTLKVHVFAPVMPFIPGKRNDCRDYAKPICDAVLKYLSGLYRFQNILMLLHIYYLDCFQIRVYTNTFLAQLHHILEQVHLILF